MFHHTNNFKRHTFFIGLSWLCLCKESIHLFIYDYKPWFYQSVLLSFPIFVGHLLELSLFICDLLSHNVLEITLTQAVDLKFGTQLNLKPLINILEIPTNLKPLKSVIWAHGSFPSGHMREQNFIYKVYMSYTPP